MNIKFMQRSFPVLFLFVIGMLIITAYSNTLYSPPILDDFHSFVFEQNVHIKDLSISSLSSISQTKFGWERWIPMLTFAIDLRVGNGDIIYFHITNIIVHIISFLCAFFLVLQITSIKKDPHSDNQDNFNKYTALWIAGLWALNPVQTSAVTYIVQRMASIQALFYILSVAMFVKGRREHMATRFRRALPYYAGCSLATVCAFLSKQNSAMLPFMLILSELWFFRPDMSFPIARRLKRVYWAAAGACVIVGLIVGVLFFHVPISNYAAALYSHRHFTLVQRLLTESRIVIWYMSLLLLPLPSRLSIEHDVVLSTSILSPTTTLFSVLLILTLLWQTFRLRRRIPLITYGCLWFFVNLAIESTVLPLELVFEHRLYLPSLGFTLCMVILACDVGRSIFHHVSRRDFAVLSGSVMAILLSVLTLMTFVRHEVWENPLTLNWDAATKAPQSPRAHANLAVALLRSELFNEAIDEAEKALKFGQEHNEEYLVAANVIVVCHLRRGDFEKAIQLGNELLDNMPRNADARGTPMICLNIAESYMKSERYQDAYRSTMRALDYIHNIRSPDDDFNFEKTLVTNALAQILHGVADKKLDLDGDGENDPGDVPLETWVAKIYIANDEREMAKELLTIAVSRNPEHLESLRMSEEMQRIDALNESQKRNWSFSEKYVRHPLSRFNICMAIAYLIREKQLPSPFTMVGETFLEVALKLEPDSSDAHLLRGWYLFEKGEVEQAVAEAKLVLDHDPDYAKAWLGLGFFLVRANHPEDAIQALDKALELYPGYSKRQVILELITELQQGSIASEVDPAQSVCRSDG
jgi:protein O-mannosyl-transferase